MHFLPRSRPAVLAALTLALAASLSACAHSRGSEAAAPPPTAAVSAASAATSAKVDPGRSEAAQNLAAFFGKTKGMRTVFASDLRADLAKDKYFVVDVRPAADYAKGHVPGAISLPLETLFTEASLAKLPPRAGKPIMLVCQTGHTASMALGGLTALGYEPYALRFAMIGWEAKTALKVFSKDEPPQEVRGLGGPIER